MAAEDLQGFGQFLKKFGKKPHGMDNLIFQVRQFETSRQLPKIVEY